MINQFIVAFLFEKKLPVDINGQNKTNKVKIGAYIKGSVFLLISLVKYLNQINNKLTKPNKPKTPVSNNHWI